MLLIAPSVLAADFNILGQEISDVVAAGADWIHYDVMDGTFVPNISVGLPVLRSIRKNKNLFIDVHLMIDRPSRYVDEFIKSGADMLNMHVEADTEEALHESFAKIHAMGKKCGITLKPATPVEAVLPFIDEVDMVLIMSVEPGFGGQPFMYDQLEKVRFLRGKKPENELIIEMDGGITVITAPAAVEAGANCLVAGKAVFGSSDRSKAIRDIRNSIIR